MNPGDRVRIIATDRSDKESTEHVGKEGVYVGIWKFRGIEEDPNVPYPLGVRLHHEGEEITRYFAREEVQPLDVHQQECS